jgi:preprotein translocase subunit SecG
MGVRKTADFLEKATWTLAISLLALSLLATLAIERNQGEGGRSAIEEQIEKTQTPGTVPTFPTSQPEGEEEKPVN